MRSCIGGLRGGEFCYVLNARQMGKSSLRVRVMDRLVGEGVVCVAIDLSGLGGETVAQWYGTLMRNVLRGLRLKGAVSLRGWLEARSFLTPLQQLGELIEEVVLREVEGDVVIFLDEIDKTLSLPFSTDDLFGFIRACYNLRADRPEYGRLTVVLLGVASPSELVREKSMTPFNVGRGIELRGFQEDEVGPLVGLMGAVAEDAEGLVREVLGWTGGQPFLTQKVCRLVGELGRQGSSGGGGCGGGGGGAGAGD